MKTKSDTSLSICCLKHISYDTIGVGLKINDYRKKTTG